MRAWNRGHIPAQESKERVMKSLTERQGRIPRRKREQALLLPPLTALDKMADAGLWRSSLSPQMLETAPRVKHRRLCFCQGSFH